MPSDNERKLFLDAIDNMPDDVLSAKFEGRQKPSARKGGSRRKTVPAVFDHTIDLHGMTRREAFRVLRQTLSRSKGKGHSILVITGRGNNSPDGRPVLREAVIGYLEKAGSLYVRSFRTAPPKHGGDGALIITSR